MYVRFDNQGTFKSSIMAIANPVSPQPYSIQLPANGVYTASAFIDQNRNNVYDDGDLAAGATINVTGSASQDLTMTGGENSLVEWHTYNNQNVGNWDGLGQQFEIAFSASNGSKKLLSAELVSGPNAIVPMDLQRCWNNEPAAYCTNIPLHGNAPQAGDSYVLKLAYTDGSSDTLTEKIGNVVGNFGLNPSPAGIGMDLTPTFAWTDPANAGSYGYTFSLTGTYPESWVIPANGAYPATFPSSIDSITWGVDPTGGSSTPAAPSLTSGGDYSWNVSTGDSDGNYSFLTVWYYPGYTGVYLPATNPSTLGPATVGQSYTGTITASAGTSPYTFTVTGLSNGLTASASGDTVTITGTPAVAGAVTFQVTVQDTSSNVGFGPKWGPVTYTINVAN
jgi:hypothetical protein